MPFRYVFHDSRDPKKMPRYFVVSPTELSQIQQHKILNDYIQSHRYEHDFGGELVEIPFPPDIPRPD
jgi:hypothetical protein